MCLRNATRSGQPHPSPTLSNLSPARKRTGLTTLRPSSWEGAASYGRPYSDGPHNSAGAHLDSPRRLLWCARQSQREHALLQLSLNAGGVDLLRQLELPEETR